MRSSLFALTLLGFTFSMIGCDDAAKKEETASPAPVVTPPAEPGKGGMDGPPPSTEKPEGAGAMTPAPATTATTTPAPEEKKEEMPK